MARLRTHLRRVSGMRCAASVRLRIPVSTPNSRAVGVHAYPEVSVSLDLSESPMRQMTEDRDVIVHIGELPESDRLFPVLPAWSTPAAVAGTSGRDGTGPRHHRATGQAARDHRGDPDLSQLFARNRNRGVLPWQRRRQEPAGDQDRHAHR
jgi:hypothetical protein